MITVEEATKQTASELFRSHSLHDITDLSAKLTTTAQAKHDELRHLVASQYRDLLKTADQIIEMNELSKYSDRELYELSFLKSTRLDKTINIERNVNKLLPIKPKTIVDRASKVQKHAELFGVLSQLLSLSSLDSTDEILEVLNKLPVEEQWFQERKAVVDAKVEELQMVIVDKTRAITIDELTRVDTFVLNTKWFNQKVIEEAVYNSVLGKVSLDNVKSILAKFTKFETRLEQKYVQDVEASLKQLRELLLTTSDKGEKLDLYSLELDDDYLDKIQYLSHGLVYSKYQQIDGAIEKSRESLKFVQLINKAQFDILNKQLGDCIHELHEHALKEKNQSLASHFV